MIIKARKTASRRTKNRIKEHGESFTLIRENCHGSLFNGQPALLLRANTRNSSDGKGGKESWFGWLPSSEIEIIND
jgi:hypothetical protein